MNCKKCGAEIAEGFNNCPQCGESVNGKKKAKKPVFKKWWFWLIIALVVIIVAGSAGGSDDTEPTTTERETIAAVGSDVSSNENASEADVEATTESQAPSNVYKVGEIFNNDGLKIAFVSAEKWTDYNEFSAPKSGNMIVRYYFEIENAGDSDKYISSYDFNAYVDGQAVEQWYYGDDSLSLTLSAGRKGNGCVYYEVPADTSVVEAEYECNIWTDEKVIFVAEF